MNTTPPGGDRPLVMERLTAQLAQRLPKQAVLLLGGAGTLVVGYLDYALARFTGYDFVVTPLYLVPVGLAAWSAGATVGVLFSILAAAVETVTMWAAFAGPARPWIVLGSIALELCVFTGAAYTIARLRWHLEYERQLSHTDPVTGIGNLRIFEEAARREIARMGRRPGPISVAYFDVDHFKEVNDRRGHPEGDRLLRTVATALHTSVRSMDTVSRVGGDEFVLLLPETDAATCRRVVDRLRGLLDDAVTAAGFDNTFSVGAVTFITPPATAAAMLSASDRVMYAVKRGARNGAEYEVVVAATA